MLSSIHSYSFTLWRNVAPSAIVMLRGGWGALDVEIFGQQETTTVIYYARRGYGEVYRHRFGIVSQREHSFCDGVAFPVIRLEQRAQLPCHG